MLRKPLLLSFVLSSSVCSASNGNSPALLWFSYSVPSYSCSALARFSRVRLRSPNSVSFALRAQSLRLLTVWSSSSALSTLARPRSTRASHSTLKLSTPVAARFFGNFVSFICRLSYALSASDSRATHSNYAATQLSVPPSGALRLPSVPPWG